jgi:CelD/BcsL family acetyltransferase involved in cellulose biosynthesis
MPTDSPASSEISFAAASTRIAVKYQIQTSFESLASWRRQWDEAVEKLGGTVYMTYDWARIWWQFYGKGKELRLMIFRAEGEVVGLLPLYIDTLGFGPLRLRVARLVGANIPPKVFDPPVREDASGPIFAEVLSQLLEKDRCDLLSFGPVSELHKSWSALEQAGREGGYYDAGPEASRDGVHTIFWLPKDMEEYYASLSKNERKNRRKYELRLLKSEYETQVDVLSDPNLVGEEFERFATQHATQWREEGKTGHFGAWPKGLEYNRALAAAQGALGRMRYIRIVANGTVICNQYTFAFGESYFWELPSRAVGKEWERFSLGPTGIVTMLEVALKEGKTRLEGGLAHYDYKLRLGAKEYPVRIVRISSNRASSKILLRFFNLIRDGLRLVYHKIWYRRIMPKLPARFWKPQSMLWVRFDY